MSRLRNSLGAIVAELFDGARVVSVRAAELDGVDEAAAGDEVELDVAVPAGESAELARRADSPPL